MSRRPARTDRPPDHLPEHVLRRSDFIDACSRRDIGEILKIAKQHAGPGFTASHLARRCELTPSRVQDYILRRHAAATVEVMTRVADGLSIPRRMLQLGPQAQEEAPVAVEQEAESARGSETQPESHSGIGAGVHLFSALTPDEQQDLSRALGSAARRVDHEVVDYFRRQFERCAGDDGMYGPRATLPTVLYVLNAIEQHAGEVPPAVRLDLLSVAAIGAEFAGWLYRDAGELSPAGHWYTRATEWAQEAGDFAMQGYLLLKKSQMAYDERDAVRVLTLAQAAQRGPWNLPPQIRVEVTQQEARGLAMIGEPVSAVERKLDAARTVLEESPPVTAATFSIGGAYNESSFTLRDASCYIEAGQPRRAAELYDDVLTSGHLSVRDHGYFMARLTSALALAGEPDAAADSGLGAIERAAATTSRRTRREVERALDTLTPWRHRPGPRALHDAVKTASGL